MAQAGERPLPWIPAVRRPLPLWPLRPKLCHSDRRYRNMNGRQKLGSPKAALSVHNWVEPTWNLGAVCRPSRGESTSKCSSTFLISAPGGALIDERPAREPISRKSREGRRLYQPCGLSSVGAGVSSDPSAGSVLDWPALLFGSGVCTSGSFALSLGMAFHFHRGVYVSLLLKRLASDGVPPHDRLPRRQPSICARPPSRRRHRFLRSRPKASQNDKRKLGATYALTGVRLLQRRRRTLCVRNWVCSDLSAFGQFQSVLHVNA